MTKEQLVSSNAKLEKSVQEWKDAVQIWKDRHEKVRKDFAKVMGQISRDYGYSNTTPEDLSWNEIFCEVGKLLQFTDRQSIERRLSDLENRASPFPNVEVVSQ